MLRSRAWETELGGVRLCDAGLGDLDLGCNVDA